MNSDANTIAFSNTAGRDWMPFNSDVHGLDQIGLRVLLKSNQLKLICKTKTGT